MPLVVDTSSAAYRAFQDSYEALRPHVATRLKLAERAIAAGRIDALRQFVQADPLFKTILQDGLRLGPVAQAVEDALR